MPEGDTIHHAAERLRALEGHVVAVAAPHPRAAALGIAERIDGRKLERVEALGKNLLLAFEGDLVLRSHLRMRGRWRVERAGSPHSGTPWLVLRAGDVEALLWHGPVLELGKVRREAIGPDIMADPLDLDAIVARLRAVDQARELGEVLLDQRVVAGIGNIWKAEGLFLAALSPWLRLRDVADDDLRAAVNETARAMRGRRGRRFVYRRAGLPCRACGARVEARRQGEDARTAYWCPACQGGTGASSA